jgi:hypothetical protein
VQSVRGLAARYRRSPDKLSEVEVCSYLLHLRDECGVARRTARTHSTTAASSFRMPIL